MSMIATAVRHLMAAGVSGEALIDAIADMEASAPQSAAEGLSKGAQRTRRYRERLSASQSVTDRHEPSQTVTSVTAEPSLSPRPPNPSALSPYPPLKGVLSPSPSVTEEPPSAAPGDAKAAVDEWNELAKRTGLPVAKTLDKTRLSAVRARLSEGGLTTWREALIAVERSPFCRGENDRGFRADLDFVCQPKSWRRLLEGFYAAKSAVPPKPIVAATGPPSEAEAQRRQRHFRDTGEWKPTWGAKPEPERRSA